MTDIQSFAVLNISTKILIGLMALHLTPSQKAKSVVTDALNFRKQILHSVTEVDLI